MIIPVITTTQLPNYETPASAGMDVRANFDNIVKKFLFNTTIKEHENVRIDVNGETHHLIESITINPGGRALIPTGLRVAIPEGYEIQVRPRSGLALKNGITLLNTPGTIDAKVAQYEQKCQFLTVTGFYFNCSRNIVIFNYVKLKT